MNYSAIIFQEFSLLQIVCKYPFQSFSLTPSILEDESSELSLACLHRVLFLFTDLSLQFGKSRGHTTGLPAPPGKPRDYLGLSHWELELYLLKDTVRHMWECREACSAAVHAGGGGSVPTLPAAQGTKCHVDIIKNETLAYQSSLPLLSLFWVLCALGISPINSAGPFFCKSNFLFSELLLA